jgi:hypothetical protein
MTSAGRYAVVLVAAAVVALCALAVALGPPSGSVSPPPHVSDAFEFRVRAGTDAWLELKSGAEMLPAVQVREEILESMCAS